MSKPICIDLFCGLGGWSEAFIAEGYECIGYDIEAHDYGTGGYPGKLILRDVRSIHGSEFKDAAVIVASPPCQEYSYMAMPWSLAKAKAKAIEADETGVMRSHLTLLFNECFRLQREASEAAGHHIPLIVENVRGAQKWVGRAPWNYGSFYLWGDIPALMPHTFRKEVMKNPDGGSWDRSRPSHTEDHSWDSGQKLNPDGTAHPPGSWFKIADSKNRGAKTVGHANIRDGHTHTRHLTNQRESDGVKFSQTGDAWFDGKPRDKMLGDKGPAAYGSKSNQRKAASAMIAKIPFPLAQHIARTFKPVQP